MMLKTFSTILLASIFLAGCMGSANQKVLQGGSQLELRSMQTRGFETADMNMVMRAIIATLQDLHFVIDKADADLGVVSATKLDGYSIKMSVTVRAKTETIMAVRANATINLLPIENPVMYQDFFSSLGKAMFLTANQID